uniref:SD03144p n=1 Tax=Drosophila melanogaster TaxID=7227 RepID=Q8T3U0_DROME|nr:SD03144p [Drosophila melanogaster]
MFAVRNHVGWVLGNCIKLHYKQTALPSLRKHLLDLGATFAQHSAQYASAFTFAKFMWALRRTQRGGWMFGRCEWWSGLRGA